MASKSAAVQIEVGTRSVRLSSPERVMWPELGITKQELAEYVVAVGPALLAANATVTMAHSRSRDLPMLARRADILIAAIGKPEFVKADWVKPGAVVIDVGINRVDAGEGKTRLVGDVDYAAAKEVAGAITPVPGGVGAMTIVCLMQNTLIAACAQNAVLQTISPRVVQMSMVRRSKTSASAPPYSPKTTSGTRPKTPVSPTYADDPVSA